MFDKKIFGERLFALRTAANISQQTLGLEMSIGKSAISMMENGQRSASAEILIALADYFDVSLDYLVGRSDDPSRH